MTTIRRTEVADADECGLLHVRSWQVAYRGLMPDDFLDDLDVGERQERWRSMLSPGGDAGPIQYVVIDDGSIVGFVSGGPARGDDVAGMGEVFAIYVDPDHVGRGLGRMLMTAAVTALVTAGFDEAVVWVLASNAPARRFYERVGWAPDGGTKQETLTRGGADLDVDEIRYRRSLGPDDLASPATA